MNKFQQYIFILMMLIISLFCMFPSPVDWMADTAFYAMFCYFFLGFLFLILRLPRLTFAAFGITAMLCLFLKKSSNTNSPTSTLSHMPCFKVSPFHPSNKEQNFEPTSWQTQYFSTESSYSL